MSARAPDRPFLRRTPRARFPPCSQGRSRLQGCRLSNRRRTRRRDRMPRARTAAHQSGRSNESLCPCRRAREQPAVSGRQRSRCRSLGKLGFMLLAPIDVELRIAMPYRSTRSTNGGSSPGRASISRRTDRNCSCPTRRMRTWSSACSNGSSSAKKSFNKLSSRNSGICGGALNHLASLSRPAAVSSYSVRFRPPVGALSPRIKPAASRCRSSGYLPIARRPKETRRGSTVV